MVVRSFNDATVFQENIDTVKLSIDGQWNGECPSMKKIVKQ